MSAGGAVPDGRTAATPVAHPQAARALLLGLLGIVFGSLCGIGGAVGLLGVTNGLEARRDIDAHPDRYEGRALATAGLVTGVVGLVVGAVVSVVAVFLVVTGRTS